jgi:hypothetical protein
MHALDALAALRGQFGPDAARRAVALLERVERARLRDPAEAIRIHDAVLYLRAFPQSPRVVKLSDRILFAFGDRVRRLDPDPFDDPEVSGIAGTTISTNFSYPVARGLVERHGRAIAIDWENFEHADRLGAVLSRLVPESREDFAVSAHPDARRWFERLRGGLGRFIDNCDPQIYDLLEIPLRWELGDSAASRSRTRIPRRDIFYHHGPFLRRKDISLDGEFATPSLAVTQVEPPAARRILGLIADTSAVRYRELYGFTNPDASHVRHCDLGRGMDFYFFGVRRDRRLLREYHAGMYFKNGVPIGYVEVLAKDRVMEVGFNLYYAFRESETAWLYARLLKVFHERLGATSFRIEPYQIGHENDEAIDSGAFWFYRKLGFQPESASTAELSKREEEKLATREGYRTPPAILRRLAEAGMLYRVPDKLAVLA